jgi:hypothetical protein
MAAGTYDFTIEQSATFVRIFIWRAGSCGCGSGGSSCGCGSTDCQTGLVDLTGYSADMQIRASASSPTILYEASTLIGNIVLGGPAGTITLTIPATDSALFTWRRGVYNLDLKSPAPDNFVTRLLVGTVTVSPSVIQPVL